MDKRQKLLNLYIKVNEMMSHLGAEGEIDTRNPLVDEVMAALYEIDNGEYLPRFAEAFIYSIGHVVVDENQTEMF